MNYFKYMRRGLAVVGFLSVVLPDVLSDGRLTVSEMARIITEVAQICDFRVSIEVPEELRKTVLGVLVE